MSGVRILLMMLVLVSVNLFAASAAEINAKSEQALQELYKHSFAAKKLAQQAAGVLVFPEVYKGGIAIGAEYGEGVLLIKGQPQQYYNIAGASIGFQLGVQIKSEVILFMNKNVLQQFRSSDGWEIGVDGSVALVTLGAGGTINSQTASQPVIGFIFSNKGLMYNLSFEGSKITPINP